jgi:hypothetical protein
MMRRATPVLPQFSNIYIRYSNFLQQKALWEHFAIDLADLVGVDWRNFTVGESITDNGASHLIVNPVHTDVTTSIQNKITKICFSYSKQLNFYWHQYLAYDFDGDISKSISNSRQQKKRKN